MRFASTAAVMVLALSAIGCAQVPMAAVDTSRQVSGGISMLGDNGRELVDAWEEMAYAMLDERWPQVYRKSDEAFRKRRGLTPAQALSVQQQEDLAGVATLVRDDARKNIRAEADKMRKVIAANAKVTLEANESVTAHLISTNAALGAQQGALKQVGGLASLPAGVSRAITDALKAAGGQ